MSLKEFKGVLHGDAVQELFEVAKKHQFALPAVNVIGTNSINAVMETAKSVNSPVIIQLSNGGAQFYAGKSLNNDNLNACSSPCRALRCSCDFTYRSCRQETFTLD
jgi:fructose-bisphosphate aldolase class II